MNPQPDTYAAPLSYGADLIKAERLRQIHQEGWTAENDDGNTATEMSRAALVYIRAAGLKLSCDGTGIDPSPAIARLVDEWPKQWNPKWFKPTTAIRDLTKAGALIAAEIDRLKRLEDKCSHAPVWQDLSFDHEFGTEKGGNWVCSKCGEVVEEPE